MGSYRLCLTTDTGARVRQLDDFISLDATRAVNQIGTLSLVLGIDVYDQLKEDYMIQVWRAPTGGLQTNAGLNASLSLFQVYFIRYLHAGMHNGSETVEIEAFDPNELLQRRDVSATEGAAGAAKTGNGDNLMKDLVDESMVSASDADRNPGDIAVAGDLSDGPSIEMTYERENVLDALRRTSQTCDTAGTKVWFDTVPLVAGNSIGFEFRTYTGQLGRDRTIGGKVFDRNRGLSDPWIVYDWRDEITVCYGWGQGEGANQTTSEQEDATRTGASKWNRRESSILVFGDQGETANGVRDAARAVVKQGEPVIRMGGNLVDAKGAVFQRDWAFGDKIAARYLNRQWNALVSFVGLHVRNSPDGRGETVEAELEQL